MNPQKRQQFLIVLTAVVVGLYAADMILVEPLLKWWAARSQTIAQLRIRVKDGEGLIQREPVIRGRWEAMNTNTLPANSAQAEQQVLRAFDGWAKDTGAEISDILPQWRDDSDDHTTLNCRVEAGGGLGTLGRFLYEIERSPIALKIDSVQLRSRDDAGRQLTLNLQVSGLVLAKTQKP
jgi:hypothetical protein